MQCFRLMNMPDRVIGFDELPEDLVKGFEMARADGFPRHWKEWLGKKKRVIRINPERDPISKQVITFPPITEEDAYFYLVDWTLQQDEEKWAEICAYVKDHVKGDYRLKEKIEDMAVPLAGNKTDSVTLEPEDVPVIPLEMVAVAQKNELPGNAQRFDFKCSESGCNAEFSSKQALKMHGMRKHPKVAA